MKLQRYKSSGHYSDGACDHGEWVKAEEAEAALEARGIRIIELKALVDRMKCCGNCAYMGEDYQCSIAGGGAGIHCWSVDYPKWKLKGRLHDPHS